MVVFEFFSIHLRPALETIVAPIASQYQLSKINCFRSSLRSNVQARDKNVAVTHRHARPARTFLENTQDRCDAA
eukprot:COSAG02_NODE_5885_length_3964_cov_2.401552_4_plen_74_part_00